MWFVPAIILVAVGIGYLLGGRLRNFERLAVHWWSLAFIGLVLQVVHHRVVLGTVAAGHRRRRAAALVRPAAAFITVNRWIPGAPVMASGCCSTCSSSA